MQFSDSPDQERRLRKNEDKLAIYELIGSYLPSADAGNMLSFYQKNGEQDRGPTLDGAHGAEDIAAFIFEA